MKSLLTKLRKLTRLQHDKKVTSLDSNLFNSNLIDLSYEANSESKAFISRLFFENLAAKIIIKLKVIADKSFNHAIKRRVEYKIQRQKALSPHDFLTYRSQYWEKVGAENYSKILCRIEEASRYSHNQHDQVYTRSLSKLFLDELFRLAKVGTLTLASSTQIPGKDACHSEIYLFYDSYYFFAGGHLNVLEESIDSLLSTNNNITFVFILDRKMILFPYLSRLILSKLNKKIIFDATRFPIKLANDPAKFDTLSRLESSHRINLNRSIVGTDLILNPRTVWKNYPYRFNDKPRKAWCTTFSRDESRDIVSRELKQPLLTSRIKNYVVVHARNSVLMTDNIRNTKSLIERKELLKGIIKIGLQVIVLGTLEPDSKFKHPDVIYLDELGPVQDKFQIHILHGAIGVIGSGSGVTHLTYCTDTPLLLLDMPFPFCSSYPASNMKVLLKKLSFKSNKISLSKYYEYTQHSYLEEVRKLKAFSPMHEDGIELECNPDSAVLHAFQELLIDTYSQSELQGLNIQHDNKNINIGKMKADKQSIAWALQKCKSGSYKSPFFEIRDLSTANWFQDQFQGRTNEEQ